MVNKSYGQYRFQNSQFVYFFQFCSLIIRSTKVHILHIDNNSRFEMMIIFREFMLLTKYNCFRRTMARHHPDLIFCRKTTGIQIGRLCAKCDGRCVICDSYARLKNMCLRVWVNSSSCVKLFTFHSVLHFFPSF